MAEKSLVNVGIAVIYFRYSDGSTVRCLATANQQILREYGIMPEPETLYDLEVKKKIPDHILELRSDVYAYLEDPNDLPKLDTYFQDYIKNTW